MGTLERDDSLDVCPSCASVSHERLVAVGQGIQMGGAGGVGKHFPYFDQSLGMHIESAQHRREVCKRMGLEPAETTGLWKDKLSAERRQKADEDAVFNDYTDRLKHHPAYADYRKAVDQGRADEVGLSKAIQMAEEV